MQDQLTDLKAELQETIEARFGEDTRVEFVRDNDRMDVRVSTSGVTDEIEAQRDDVRITNYSEFRFTVMLD